MSKRVADVLVETLQAAGVKRCYGVVGDTLNRIAHAISDSEIDWVHMRHEEAGAFAAGAEAQYTGHLTACAGSCGPGSLHFINGLYEANRNRAPVILIASQIVRRDLGFQSIQEVDFNEVYKGCSVWCEMIVTPEHARRKTVAACQAALTKRGVAVLVVPADIANAPAHDEAPYAVHARRPLVRPIDADLDEIAAILNESEAITIYAGAGCAAAHDEVAATAARLKAPMAHTSRGKDFVEYDNPYNVGMTGMIGEAAGYHAILNCDALLLLGTDFAWSQFYPDKAKIIQIDADPTHIGRRHPVTIGAVGDIKATLDALLPRLEQHDDNSFLFHHLERHRKERAAADAETVSGPDATIPGTYLAKVINKHAAEDALFTVDDGTVLVWTLRHVDTGGKRRTFASLLHGTMASGMPSAIGLQKCQLRLPGGLHGGRRRLCHATRRSFDCGARESADQDRDIRQRQARLHRYRAEVRRHGSNLHRPEEPGFWQSRRGDGALGTVRLKSGRPRRGDRRLAGATRSGVAGRESKSHAAGDAAVAIRVT